jgi:hypothetical protein
MAIGMKNLERLSLAEMQECVRTNRHVGWPAVEAGEVYGFIKRVLKAHQCRRLKKGQKGVVGNSLAKITGLSRAQATRLIQRWMETRRERKPAQRPNFPRRHAAAEIATLAEVDTAHEDLSGPAVRHLCRLGW